MFVLGFILCALSQCFAAYGRTCAQSKTFAFVLAVVLNVAGSKGGRLKAVFTLVFCALAAGDDAAIKLCVLFHIDLIARIGEAMSLSEQDGFEHGQQGIGGTASVVSNVTGSLTIQVLLNRLPINHLIQLQ